MVHELLGQPSPGVDGLGGVPEQSAVSLESCLLALGILPDFLSMLFDQKLQVRLFQLPLKLLGAQFGRGASRPYLGVGGRGGGRLRGGVGGRRGSSVVVGLAGRGVIARSFSGVSSGLRGNGGGSKTTCGVRSGLFCFLLAGHGEAMLLWGLGCEERVAGPGMASRGMFPPSKTSGLKHARKFCDSGCRSTECCVCWDLERPGTTRRPPAVSGPGPHRGDETATRCAILTVHHPQPTAVRLPHRYLSRF